MGKIFLVLSLYVPSVLSLLSGFPSPITESSSPVFSSTGDITFTSESITLKIGPDKAAVEEIQSGLISDVEVTVKTPLEFGVAFEIEIEESALEELIFSVRVTPPYVVAWALGRNETCQYEMKEEVKMISVHFGILSAIVSYQGAFGKKECVEIPFTAFGRDVRYRVTAASAKPRTVMISGIRWEAAADPYSALVSLQSETLKQINSLRATLASPQSIPNLDEVLQKIKDLGEGVETMEQRLIAMLMRWEALKTTEYMTRPEHLIHHFRIVLRDLEREVGHLYDRISHGALSEYAERFIHERKEVFPMEVLLGAYAWQVEKKLGDLKQHIETMERFTYILAIAAALVVCGFLSGLVVRKAEKLHKL